MLDIGCGDGNFVYWLQETGYTEAFGLDISQQQIDEGLKLGIKNLSCADLKDYLKNSAHCFDTIFARDVIEHFTRDEVFEIMNMVRQKLNPGGKFIIQVPNGQGLFHTSIFYGDYTHEMAYTSSSINQIILNTGFKGSYCFSAGPVPTGVVSSLRFVLWKCKELQLRFWKGVETGNPSGIFTQNLIAVISN
jgi:cyclopropane fatty-acyl-phospholipid synthase-like methyltransferase